MTDQRQTPASQRRQAEGITGVRDTERSVAPGWSRKRQPETLLRFRGEYLTPEELHARAASEARAASRVGVAHGDAPPAPEPPQKPVEAGPPVEAQHPAPTLPTHLPRECMVNPETGEWVKVIRVNGVPYAAWETDWCSLPCRSLETTQPNGLTGPHRKTAAALSINVAHLCQKHGTERVGFLTLTFADHVICPKEAQRRFNSLATHVLRERYADYIRVIERQKSGRIHYHLLVVLADDIRTGFDFAAASNRDYSSANNHLRREWAFWRKTAKNYGFGRTELMPIKGSSDALGQYVGKYIGKHMGSRKEEDKGVRLVGYTRGARIATSRHTPIGTHIDKLWRGKVATFARQMSTALRVNNPHHPGLHCLADIKREFGPRWSYHWREYIFQLPPSDLAVPF